MVWDTATWIYYDEISGQADEGYGCPVPYFRKEFTASQQVTRATLYASALGVFKAYINGEAVAGDYMSPGWTDYRKRIPLIEYDVTRLIAEHNAIGIVGGDGWAVGYLGNRVRRHNYNDRIEIFASLRIEYADGSVEHVDSDGSWKVSHGAIRRTDNFMGEYVDARESLGDFSVCGYDDSSWESAKETNRYRARKSYYLEKAIAPITVVKHVLTPSFLYTDKDGKAIYDFFQNFSGVPSVTVKGKRGARITFRYGEMLNPDGTVYRGNLRKAEATDIYVLAGNGEEKFRPLFTFHGFRYMEAETEGEAEIISVTGEVMYSDLKCTADFTCSDETVNRLYKNIVWSQRGNFLNVPTDCPQRDERLGWTGDSQVFCGTAMYNMDCRDFYRKHIGDICDAQASNGGITGVAPAFMCSDYSLEDGRLGAAGWADVITVLPYEYYKMYGDKSVIKDNLHVIKKYIKYCLRDSEDYIRPAGNNYGDWLSVGEQTDSSLVATAFFAHSVRLTAYMCETVDDDDCADYVSLYEKIKHAFRNRFLDKSTGKLLGDTQTDYVLAYSFGLMSACEIKPHLLCAIERSGGHLATGFLGVKYLLPVLCDIGESDLAYSVFTERTYPSWCFSVVNGATTVWERWNSYTREQGFGDEKMNSFNHYAYGSVGEWMFRYVLGIVPSAKQGSAGFKKVTLRPYIDKSGKLKYAKGYYDSIAGRIEAEWRAVRGGYRYTAKVPAGMQAEYDFGDFHAEKTGDGEYFLTVKDVSGDKTDEYVYSSAVSV